VARTDYNTLFVLGYSRLRPSDLRHARSNLAQSVDKVLAADYQVENPVTNVRGRFQLELHATPEQKLLIGQLRSVEQRLASLEDSSTRTNIPASTLTNPANFSPDFITFYAKGDYVKHHKFGVGPVILVDGNKLTVDFPGGRKRVIDGFVQLALPPPNS
jgi:transcription elongation factor GreA-like protein